MTGSATPAACWSPILEGELASRAREAVDAVAGDLRRRLAEPGGIEDPSLATGLAGIAVFFAYLDRAFPGRGHDHTAVAALERAVESMAQVAHVTTLYTGYPGIAWAAEHLRRMSLFEDDEDAFQEVDEAVLEALRRTPFDGPFDLTRGLAGLGLYALERLPSPAARESLERVVGHLRELAEERDAGLTWPTRPELFPDLPHKHPVEHYDLGVSHGIPGVPPVLALSAEHGIVPEEARRLLSGAVPWLLGQRLPGSLYPTSRCPGRPAAPTRPAWCYGAPGVAAALLWTARAAGRPDWEGSVLEIARAAARIPPEGSGVPDAGLCHGTAGIGHILHRIYQATGEAFFRESALVWLRRTLDLRGGQGIGGFRQRVGDPENPWQDAAGWLLGSAGVALALLAAIAPVEPAWDRLLLISVPPGGPRGRSEPLDAPS